MDTITYAFHFFICYFCPISVLHEFLMFLMMTPIFFRVIGLLFSITCLWILPPMLPFIGRLFCSLLLCFCFTQVSDVSDDDTDIFPYH
jgi:hypothetical protein